MLTVCGIDWSTAAARRYAVTLSVDSGAGRLQLTDVVDKVDDAGIHAICSDCALDSVGVDVAFGWPEEFCTFVAGWRPGAGQGVEAVEPGEFMFRDCDRAVSDAGLGRPLSVSTNLLGRSAQAWTHQFLMDSGPERSQIDVFGDERTASSGRPHLVEVYPKATLAALQRDDVSGPTLALERFDRRDVDSRRALLEALEPTVGLSGLDAASFASNEHRVDALLAAIATAIYAASCRTDIALFNEWSVARPTPDQRDAAAREGWIFFPVRDT